MSGRLGVLAAGCGGIGRQNHQRDMYLPALLADPRFEVLGVVATGPDDAAAAAATAEQFGLPRFEDFDKALTEPAVEAVCLAAPFEARPELLERTIRAGKHVLADKPLTSSTVTAERIAALAAEHGVVVVPAHHLRLGGTVRSAVAALRSGRVGLPWNVQADLVVAGGDRAPTGELVNLGLYVIDVVGALVQVPVRRVRAVGGAAAVTVLLDHDHGLTSTAVIARTAPVPGRAPGTAVVHRYRISGTHGVLLVDATKPAVHVESAVDASTTWAGPDTVSCLVSAFHASVRTGRAAPSVQDAVEVQRVVEAAVESLRTGVAVTLEPGAPR